MQDNIPSRENPESWNYRVLLAQGGILTASWQLTNPTVVLPFLFIAHDAPIFLAGLFAPLMQTARLFSGMLAAPVVAAASNHKWYLMIVNVAFAISLIAVAASLEFASAPGLAMTFLFAVTMIGVAAGLSGLLLQDLVGSVLGPDRRGDMMFGQMAIAGVLAAAVAWGTHAYFFHEPVMYRHVLLLWFGIGGFFAAALMIVLVLQSDRRSDPDCKQTAAGPRKPGFFKSWFSGFRTAALLPWFSGFMIVRLLLLSVELAIPFYAIQAALNHKDTPGSLSALVVSAGIAMLVSGSLWRSVSKISIKLVLILGCVLAVLAGVLALVTEIWPSTRHIAINSVVIFILTVAGGGISQARKLHLLDLAPPAIRSYCLSAVKTTSGIVTVGVATIFSAMAHFQHVSWPIVVIVILNLFACASIYWLPKPDKLAADGNLQGAE